MTTTDFGTPNARAVLIATSRHLPGSGLSDLETVEAAVRAAADCLVKRCGLSTDQIDIVIDEGVREVSRRLDRAAMSDGPLIIWYVGHGVVGAVTDEAAPQLFLATADTTAEPRELPRTALPYAEIRAATTRRRLSRNRPTLIILDSCYSGRATALSARVADAGFNLSSVQGTHVITAADDDVQALVGRTGPVLTTTIVEILRDGDTDGPPSFTVNGLFETLCRRLDSRNAPPPRQHSHDGVGSLVLASNPRYRHPQPPLPTPGEPEPGWDSQACPFPGPRPIEPRDRRLLFGRNADIEKLVNALNEQWEQPGPRVITGPSGVGKSSLVQAGLLPSIKDGLLAAPGVAGWPQWTMTPGRTPMTAWRMLARSGRAETGDADAASVVTGPLVLVVDQLEQIFAQDVDPDERNAFLDAVTTVADLPDVLVLLVVSADHIGRCLRHPTLRAALGRMLVVDPLPLSALHDIVAEPARIAGLGVEEGLIAAITADADAGVPLGRDGTIAAGALPHIAGAIHRTWQNREAVEGGYVLTTAAYRTGGGIRDALGRTAEETYESLTPVQKLLAERLLLDLVGEYETAGTLAETRRRVLRADLDRPDDPPGELDEVIDAFAAQRLLALDGSAETETVELAHEALIGAWPRLRTLIDRDREWFRLRSRMDADADEYARHPSRDRLYRGRRLAAVEDAMAGTGHTPADVGERTRRFLSASRRHRRLLRSMVAFVAVVLLALTGASTALGVINGRQRDDATAKALAARAEQLMPDDPALGRQLAVAGYAVAPNADARTSLLAAQVAPDVTRVRDHPQQSFSSASSPDGRVLATAGAEGVVNVWDMTSPRQPVFRIGLQNAGRAVLSVAVSRDGAQVAAGDEDGLVHVWRLTGPRTAAPVHLPPLDPSGRIMAVAFDDDGRRLATGSSRGRLLIVPVGDEVAPPPRPRELKTGINALAFRPGGDLVAGALDSGDIGIWRLDNSRIHDAATNVPQRFGLSAKAVTFSPDGGQLAVASAAGDVRLWSVTSTDRLAAPQRLTGAQDPVYALAFSPDSTMLAGATNNGRALVWQPTVGDEASESLPHSASVHGVRFAADGRSLVTSGQDGILRVWNRPGRDIATGQAGPILAAFTADGRVAATGGMSGTVRLWSIGGDGSPALTADLPKAYQAPVQRMAFSPSGTLLAVPVESGEVDLWDVTRPANPVFVTTVPGTAQTSVSYAVAFSPDGKLLAVGGQAEPPPEDGMNGTLRVWNIVQPGKPLLVGNHRDRRGGVAALSFSADGRLLAAGGGDGEVNLYRADTPQMPRAGTVSGNRSFVHAVRFAPEAHRLAVGDERGRVRIVDTDHPDQAPELFAVGNSVVLDVAWVGDDRVAAADNNNMTWIWKTGETTPWARLATHDGPVFSVGADRAGRTVITAGADGRLQVLDTDPGRVRDTICRGVGMPMDDTEWQQIEPGSGKPRLCD
ncbi:WD40 repeat domain-containing protein [Micromonospora sp. MH99]|uniref:WD40 repeat domain-containing protein n=1 Tax=Micromonospora sp. MH99 TaxID=1945510 RepID=UPI001F470344|nr:WD40 repeat domain-containing protein [Micromonospora sp. MH99]MCF0091701.1 hypothetical protein [Micromonospora sp. MH99]